MRILLILSFSVILAGCASMNQSATQRHPNAVDAVDADTYDGLLLAKSVIDDTRTGLDNNAFPPSISDNVRKALVILVASYNALDTLEKQYHVSPTPAVKDQIVAAKAKLDAASSGLVSAKVGKP